MTLQLLQLLGAERLDAERHVLQILRALLRGDDDVVELGRLPVAAASAAAMPVSMRGRQQADGTSAAPHVAARGEMPRIVSLPLRLRRARISRLARSPSSSTS